MRRRLTDADHWLRSQLERDFQRSVVEAATALGWQCWHDNDPRRNKAGFLDLLLIRERVVWAELKTETGRLRPAQQVFMCLLRRAGQECYVWRPSQMDEIIAVLTARKGGGG